MGWFGGGDDSSGGSTREQDFSSHDEVAMSSGRNMMAAPSGVGGGGAGMAELQQASLMLQQQLLVQQVINDLPDRSYEKCVTSKPSDTLTGSQVACIKATVNKWLDTNEFMTGRLQKKSQAQRQGQFN